MRTRSKFSSLLCTGFCLAVLLTLAACAKTTQNLAPPSNLTVGVALFTQPKSNVDMMAGYMAEAPKPVDPKLFAPLDANFIAVVNQKTQRVVLSASVLDGCQKPRVQSDQRPALTYWVQVGKCMGVDLLVVPQVISWHEREGGDVGVQKPASVIMDFFLIDVKQGVLISRSRYDETQAALAENLLDTGKFISRGGKWVNAMDLAKEGMAKAVKDFAL